MDSRADTPEMTELRERLQRLRDRGWTRAAIADELGVDWDTVWRWATGRRRPRYVRPLLLALEQLEQRRRIPKRKRYDERSGGRYVKSQAETPPATDDGTGDS